MTGRPDMEPPYAEFYDWLARNGVDEWIPDGPSIIVSPATLTYTAFVFTGPRGWDHAHVAHDDGDDCQIEWRTVPLLAPLTDRIRELLEQTDVDLEERAACPGPCFTCGATEDEHTDTAHEHHHICLCVDPDGAARSGQ